MRWTSDRCFFSPSPVSTSVYRNIVRKYTVMLTASWSRCDGAHFTHFCVQPALTSLPGTARRVTVRCILWIPPAWKIQSSSPLTGVTVVLPSERVTAKTEPRGVPANSLRVCVWKIHLMREIVSVYGAKKWPGSRQKKHKQDIIVSDSVLKYNTFKEKNLKHNFTSKLFMLISYRLTRVT